MKKHFSVLSCVELILKGFSSPVLLMSCPLGPFGSWKFDLLNFSSPLSGCRARRGLLGTKKFDIFDFSSPLSGCRARRGLVGAENLTFFNLFKPLVRLSCPQGPFRSWKFDFLFFKPGNCVFDWWKLPEALWKLPEAPWKLPEAPRKLPEASWAPWAWNFGWRSILTVKTEVFLQKFL